MEKTNDELIREFAKSMYDMPQSLCCSYCTKEKCITDKKGGLSHKSCVDCISDYWKAKEHYFQVIEAISSYNQGDSEWQIYV